ncbi:prolyl oligopeptidase family serine peptidase [Maribellus sp. YY47]|uniref:S9 family peptidase n=1 Tax=Maribellus sp. YY47 TaxID=2929486 RepID=UPI002001857E|nr:prolyl oligopeptidase family serine peptidase [Maribellus sp. YY47]MCK3686362.1 prolyl oligopeptidase family serine peptidase [Maribellus sp. YY47]
MRKAAFIVFAVAAIVSNTFAQVDLTYQKPPKEILELVDAPGVPTPIFDYKNENIVLLNKSRFKSIAELSETEMRLAGLRINPVTNIGSRTSYYTNISLMKVGEPDELAVSGLPEQPAMANFSWSPDQSKMAFTQTTSTGVELWLLDIATATCKKLTDARLNANLGTPFEWFESSDRLLVKFIPDDRQPLIDKTTAVPIGPSVSVSDGTKAQNRTYQDLLKDKADEFNFEQLVRSTLYTVDLNGAKAFWKETAMYSDCSFSPDGKYILVETLQKPFSYLVTSERFPQKTVIYDQTGNEIKVVRNVPLEEVRPQGFMATTKEIRSLRWRTDKPAELYYVKALDEGDPANEVDFRDEVFTLNAPFDGAPVSILKTKQRYIGITWGNDETAIAYDRWWNTRNVKTYLFNPSDPTQEPEILFDRNENDYYNDPGNFVTDRNELGKYTLTINKNKVYLTGNGYSPEGIRPFFDEFDLKTKENNRLWRADGKETLEYISKVLDAKNGELLTRVEASTTFPNYYIRNLKKRIAPVQITFFKNPIESLNGIYKEVITYKRDDGIELSGTLYLPEGYDREKKEKLPMILWAYPREYKDKSTAGQVTSSPHTFTYPGYGSVIFWVTQGYAILDGAAFPIVGEGDKEPNDTFIKQLVANGKAAIDAVDERGYIDRNRVAVGGHSYGAFMTANLLSHSDLFAAGIARSGAYNRTLTPFGFQSEERTYWEAPDVYYNMSPFMHADQMKTPLLLIHGEADNNAGTYPLQSERYFNALKGLGATVRLVILPKESHGYAARESILHMLWEQNEWLTKYVKNK